jgi:hypothetical protein
MKTALSRILEFCIGHDRREKNISAKHSYCICGALKPEVTRQEPEASSNAGAYSGHLMKMARK